jgi:MoaE-MoaD fusion protein
VTSEEGDGVRCEIRLLGGLTERAGAPRVEVEVPPGTTVARLREAVGEQHPSLAPLLGRVKVAMDLEVADEDAVVVPDAQLALLPPVAGGAEPRTAGTPPQPPDEAPEDVSVGTPTTKVRGDGRRTSTGLARAPLDLDAATSAVVGPEVGGTAVFVGSVRDHAPDLDVPVTHLEYSAYPEMAEHTLAVIAEELLDERPQLQGVALHHAVGRLPVGEHTVLIACGAAHRDEAFDACREALERVKDRVPVFKREITQDGAHRWVGLNACGGH